MGCEIRFILRICTDADVRSSAGERLEIIEGIQEKIILG
jgi:hypothetical protein